MLKLDAETRDIPVLTYTAERTDNRFEGSASQFAEEEEEELLPARPAPALRMN
jgi:hypothetical protein